MLPGAVPVGGLIRRLTVPGLRLRESGELAITNVHSKKTTGPEGPVVRETLATSLRRYGVRNRKNCGAPDALFVYGLAAPRMSPKVPVTFRELWST